MGNVYVAGVGMTAFGRHLEKGLYDLTSAAVAAALADAGAEAAQVEALYYATATNGALQGQHSIPGPIAARHAGIAGVPVFSVENACASGSSAFHLAVQAVQAGACDIALALGAEKMNIADKAKMFAVFDSGWDVETVEKNKATLLALGAGLEVPPGTTSDKPYSVFMEVYASLCRAHMRDFGTTRRQIAAVAAKNHAHSVHNPLAQFREAMSIEQVLAAPPITYPLTLPMCSPISDGAAAVVVCSDEGLKRLGAQDRQPDLPADVLALPELIDRASDYDNDVALDQTGHTAMMRFTGGTTGKGKCAMYTPDNIMACRDSFFVHSELGWDARTRALHVAPLSHGAAMLF